jgi:phosphopantetheinyl transferase (holo-ACP synthase)
MILLENIRGKKIHLGVESIADILTAHEASMSAAEAQSAACRRLADKLWGEHLVIGKNQDGKPEVENKPLHVSLSHTTGLAGAIVSEGHQVGMDIEWLNPKIERIAAKFLTSQELDMPEADRLERLILYWSAKEAMYKLYAKRKLEFKTQLLIAPFELAAEGVLQGSIIAPGYDWQGEVHYRFFANNVVTYVID